MAESGIVKGMADEHVNDSPLNQQMFLVKMLLNSVNTALPVIVEGVEAGDKNAAGYVNAKPLISQIDAWGNAVPMATLQHLPYFRLQAGSAGIIIDPVPGDIGLAVFAQSDCSTLRQGQNKTERPGSWRKHDQADGFYVGGFINLGLDVFIRLTQGGKVQITAPGGVDIDTPNATFTGDITCGGFSYLAHTHTGVHGETTPPH